MGGLLMRRQLMVPAGGNAKPQGWLYHFDGDLLSSGTEDFGFTGPTDYATGVNGQAYYKNIQENDAKSIAAVGLTKIPNLAVATGGTLSFWWKTGTANQGWGISAQKTIGTSTSAYTAMGNHSNVKSGWSVTKANIQKKFGGSRIGWESSAINVRVMNNDRTRAANFKVTPPSSFDSTQWHHFALTVNTDYDRFFIDGEMIFQFGAWSINFADQFSVGGLFLENASTPTEISTANKIDLYFDDLYIAEFCKWTSNFDPYTIVY